MKSETTNKAIFVLTGRGIETMVSEGGSQAWVINSNSAKECNYVVCIQNHRQDYFPKAQLSANDRTAFLVGKLAGVTSADPEFGEKENRKKKLLFSAYAKLDMPDAWPGNRNPVFYGDLESFGIDVTALDFQPMPALKTPTDNLEKHKPLTISQAKAGLALHFGVSDADIEIVIRG